MAIVHVTTPQELLDMANDLAGDYVLDNALDMTGVTWVPVGTYEDPFTGTFDGRGHIISNFTYDPNNGYTCFGLFGRISGATLQNVILNGVTVAALPNLTYGFGALTGGGTGTITECHVTGLDVQGGTAWLCVGGLVGAFSGTITNCSVSGSITFTGTICYDVGGLAGEAGNVINCDADVDITITASSSFGRIGGLVGSYVILQM